MKRITILLLSILTCSQLPAIAVDQKQQGLDSLKALYNRSEYEQMIYLGKELIEGWEVKDTLDVDYAELLLDMARVHINLEDYPTALHYNTRALAVFLRSRDSMGISRTYSNFAGIYYFIEDSAQAFHYIDLTQKYYPQGISSEEKARFVYMNGLLQLKFGERNRALRVIDSLILELEEGNALRAYVMTASFQLMDSTEFLIRYPNILSEIMTTRKSPNFRLTALLDALKTAVQYGRLDILKKYWNQVQKAYHTLGVNATIGQKVDYSLLQAQLKAYDKDYEAAFRHMRDHASYLSEQDSLQGLKDMRKLETQIKVKENALRTQSLQKALDDSRQQAIILGILTIAAILIIFLIYRINYNTQEKSKFLSQVASTRGKMISMLSHDIRGPLAQLHVLLEQYHSGNLSESELKDLLAQISQTTRSTTKLLDKIVDWINLNRGDYKLNLEEFAVGDLFNDLEEILASRLENKEIKLDYQIDHEFLKTDRFLLQTAILNILSNAVKFSEAGNRIILASYLEDNSAVIEVKDFGKGIDAEDLNKLRNEMSTTSLGTHAESGSGLGLVIVRDAVAKIKANFTIDSKPGEGTTCRITI